jgi:hypothetical protein
VVSRETVEAEVIVAEVEGDVQRGQPVKLHLELKHVVVTYAKKMKRG